MRNRVFVCDKGTTHCYSSVTCSRIVNTVVVTVVRRSISRPFSACQQVARGFTGGLYLYLKFQEYWHIFRVVNYKFTSYSKLFLGLFSKTSMETALGQGVMKRVRKSLNPLYIQDYFWINLVKLVKRALDLGCN